jgi:predicted O-methyltransferase YrrM
MPTTDYLRQRVSLLRDPVELADRALNKALGTRDRQPPRVIGPGGYPTRDEVRRHAREHWGYEPVDDWSAALAAMLGGSLPGGFDEVWAALARDLDVGEQNMDADRALGHTVWAVVRAVKPEAMVETGVSRGVLTRIALEAMEANGRGHLHSIDLPPIGVHDESAAAVPSRLGHRWTYHRGSSRRHLRRILARLGTIDVFLHDSQHTERNMRFELGSALPRVRPGGFVLSDDVHENAAWAEIARGRESFVAQEQDKGGMFGVLPVRSAPLS